MQSIKELSLNIIDNFDKSNSEKLLLLGSSKVIEYKPNNEELKQRLPIDGDIV